MHVYLIRNLLFILLVSSFAVHAEDVLTVKNVGMELGRDLVNEAVKICRAQGYQVSAVVVDRNGILRAALRDDLAARFTLQMAEEKANAAVLAGTDSVELRKNRQDIRPELNNVDGILVLEGGVLITAGGYRLGALGVSGAPGGDKDAVCAKQAIKALEERLEFAQ